MQTSPPISFTAAAWKSSTTGYPNGSAVLRVPHRLEAYQHTVTAAGGEEAAELQLTTPRSLAQQWFGVIGGPLQVYDRTAMRVFDGLITTVEVNDGATTQSLTTDGMANAVYVQYTVNGVSRTTSRAVSASSIARYHRRELLYAAGERTATEAAAERDALLTQLAWPIGSTSAALTRRPGVGEASVTIRVRGYWHALTWASYQVVTKTGTRAASASLILLVNETLLTGSLATYGVVLVAGSSATQIAYTGPSIDEGTGPSGVSFPVSKQYATAADVAAALLARGTSGGVKVAYGYNLRLLPATDSVTYLYARAWAGASPTGIDYYVRPPGLLLGSAKAPVPWTQVRPDTMVQVLSATVRPPSGGPSVDNGERFWCARVEYRWARGQGESVVFEPEGGDARDPGAVLARVR